MTTTATLYDKIKGQNFETKSTLTSEMNRLWLITHGYGVKSKFRNDVEEISTFLEQERQEQMVLSS